MASDIYHDRLEIPIGSTFFKAWPITDSDTGLAYDLTGCTALCEVRTSYGGGLITRFHTADVAWDGLITLTSVGSSANLQMSMTAALTELLAPQSGVFDVYVMDALGQPYRVVYGKAFVTPEVST